MLQELAADERAAALDERQQRIDVARWRRAEREKHLEARLAMELELRRRHTERIAEHLEQAIGRVAGLTVSAYWPMRGEPDLRGLMERLRARGGRYALPVVVERGRPLVFRCWAPGEPLERGIWNIPVPAGGAEVEPDVVIAPVVAFDQACYRLGYGGGYFDRTLAAMAAKPRVFGVGYALAAVATIYPQPHDIPMDAIVTQTGTLQRASKTEPARVP
jgi:5,10-methenyltetrahydrofolate synthetase